MRLEEEILNQAASLLHNSIDSRIAGITIKFGHFVNEWKNTNPDQKPATLQSIQDKIEEKYQVTLHKPDWLPMFLEILSMKMDYDNLDKRTNLYDINTDMWVRITETKKRVIKYMSIASAAVCAYSPQDWDQLLGLMSDVRSSSNSYEP